MLAGFKSLAHEPAHAPHFLSAQLAPSAFHGLLPSCDTRGLERLLMVTVTGIVTDVRQLHQFTVSSGEAGVCLEEGSGEEERQPGGRGV